jgi:hypothetical protein
MAVFAVAALAIAVGVAAIGAGMWVDAQREAELNTRVLWYTVSTRMNGTGPVRLILPAPSDARFFDALNATNGSSTLRLNHTSSDTNVVLTAYGNVSFQIRAQVAATSGNWSFTRTAYSGVTVGGPVSMATVELWDMEEAATVLLSLAASISWLCEGHLLQLDSTVHPGIASYPADAVTVVC